MKKRSFKLGFYFTLVVFAIMSASILLISPIMALTASRGHFAGMDIMATFVVLYLLSMVAGVTVSAIVGHRILKPILRFSDALKEVSAGNFQVQVPEDRRIEELSTMAKSFNRMVQQLQNQTIDNTTDTSDMLNQLVQMSVVQMMTTVKTSIDTLVDANTLTYAASLVGQTVTVGRYDDEGNLQEIVGEVTGTGTYQGVQVIFVDGEMYALSDIMAIGRLPEVPEAPEEPPEEGSGGDGDQGTETPEV